jgi:hypothetical protein
MRLPGTFNLVGNDLPTLEYLQRLKQRKAAAREVRPTDEFVKGAPRVPKSSANATGDNKPNEVKESNTKEDNTFTPAQDASLIDLKLKDAIWKDIAAELGKEVGQVKERFKVIKPSDFDKRHQELKDAAKTEKQQQGGGEGGGNAGQNNNNEKKEDHYQQQGGKKGKKNKGKGPQQPVKEAEDNEEEGEEWWEQPDGNWSRNDVSPDFHVHS